MRYMQDIEEQDVEEVKYVVDNSHVIGGCLPSKRDIRDYQIYSANSSIDVPREFRLEGMSLVKVKDQQMVNACAAHSGAEICEYHDKGQHTMSTNFIYGIQKKLTGYRGMGMSLATVCDILCKYGDCLEQDCPGNTEVPYTWDIAEKAFADEDIMHRAYHFRALSYYNCQCDEDVKYGIFRYGGPVLAGIDWTNEYVLDKDNVIHFNPLASGGGHAVVVWGWTDKGWLIRNSWGESFGDKGDFILPYEYGLMEARVLIDAPDEVDEICGVLQKPHSNMPKFLVKIINKVINGRDKSL